MISTLLGVDFGPLGLGGWRWWSDRSYKTEILGGRSWTHVSTIQTDHTLSIRASSIRSRPLVLLMIRCT